MFSYQITSIFSFEACYFWSVSGSPHRYRNAVSNIIQNCPLGTVFKADYCVCVQDTAFSRRGKYPNDARTVHNCMYINLQTLNSFCALAV